MSKTKTIQEEKKPNKSLVKEGRFWHMQLHTGLGYRICEDDYNLQSLALTMRHIRKNLDKQATLSQRQNDVKEFINELRKIKDTTRDVDNWIEIDNLIKKYEQEIKNENKRI